MLDILCIGDSVIDIFLKIPTDDPKFSLNKDNNKLSINLGDKISVDKYLISIGGNATNTAVGASKLGLKSGLCAEIGNDEFSQKILSALKTENINTDLIIHDKNKQTSITVALSFNGERTLFTEHVEREHNFEIQNTSTKLIYLTSLGHKWENAYKKVYELKDKSNFLLAFNPGSLQLENKNRIILDIIERSDYLFINKQEAEEILYGKELGLAEENHKSLIKKLLFGLRSLGAKTIIITDSSNGSYLYDLTEKMYHLDIVKVDVVEKTGAGDSFTAGFLSAILNHLDEKEAMIWGAINSSSVIQKIGAQNGLLTKDEINNYKTSLGNFYPQEL